MIHATFADDSTMLFDPDEQICVCDDVLCGEYIVNDQCGPASKVIKPGVFVLSGVSLDASEAPIISVREV